MPIDNLVRCELLVHNQNILERNQTYLYDEGLVIETPLSSEMSKLYLEYFEEIT